jgi:hypothetical protein
MTSRDLPPRTLALADPTGYLPMKSPRFPGLYPPWGMWGLTTLSYVDFRAGEREMPIRLPFHFLEREGRLEANVNGESRFFAVNWHS